MTGEKDYGTEKNNLAADSKSKNMITNSSCSTELLQLTIEYAKTSKETQNSKMDSVISLMTEVEHREKLAKEAAENIGRNSLDIFAKVERLKQEHISAKETNRMRAKEVYAEREVLADELDALQISVAGLLSLGDSSVGVLDEIHKALEIRLISALTKKEEAEKHNLEMEVSARKAVAYGERQMEQAALESETLEREAINNLKTHEFLDLHGHEVDTLREEITSKYRDVNQLKVKLDQAIVLSDLLPSTQSSSIWWDTYGKSASNLKKIAMRILSLTISSTGCERAWSMFEVGNITWKLRDREPLIDESDTGAREWVVEEAEPNVDGGDKEAGSVVDEEDEEAEPVIDEEDDGTKSRTSVKTSVRQLTDEDSEEEEDEVEEEFDYESDGVQMMDIDGGYDEA